MREKRFLTLAVIVAVVAVLVGGAYVAMGIGNKGIAISKKEKVNPTIASAIPYGSDTILYVSEANMATRNLKSGAAKIVSDNDGISSLEGVHSLSTSQDKRYILFRDDLAPSDSALYQTLIDEQLNPDLGYWWVYDTTNKTFRPIPQQDTLQARLDGDNVLVLAASNSYTTITTYELSTLDKRSTMDTPPATDFFLGAGGYLLQYDGDIYFTKDGVVNNRVLESVKLFGITADGQHAIGLRGEGDASELVIASTADWSAKTAASNISPGIAWLDSGLVLYSVNYGSDTKPNHTLYTYDITTDKTTTWDTGGGDNSSYVPQTVFNGTTALVSDDSGAFYLIGNDLKNYPTE